VVFGKDGSALPIVRRPGHLAVPADFRKELLGAVDAAVDARIAAKGDWYGETVYVEPGLDRLLLPDQLRATAQGLVQVERGSRLPVGEAKVVRLFIHWREADETSDLDLSCIALDASFGIVDQVSWTNLGNGVLTHSGDLTSAAEGAEEFLDIDLAKAAQVGRKRGWRYLVPVVFRYAGPTFEALPEAYTGWMLRDDATSKDRVFDPATVANAFALTGRKRRRPPLSVPRSLDATRKLKAGSRRTRRFRARGSAARPGSAGWPAPHRRRPASRTLGRSPRRGSSGRPPPSPGP
jgi:hypothetical protein